MMLQKLGFCLRATTSLARALPAGLVALSLLLGNTAPSEALVLNDDAAQAAGGIGNYYDRGNFFSNVAALVNKGGAFCTGSLINSRTILTAAHCVEQGPRQIYISSQTAVSFSPLATAPNPNNRYVSGVAAHTGYAPGPLENDIALISLGAPVTGIRPVTLVAKDAPVPAEGTVIRFVGYGASGTGSKSPERATGPYDDKRRIGDTLFAGYLQGKLAGFPGNEQYYIMAQFQNPEDPDDAPGPIPRLQAGGAPGDSGGPLFMMTENGLVQIGVTDWVTNFEGPQFGYRSITGWTPVIDYLEWIARNNPLREVSARAGDYLWSNPAAWQDLYSGASGVPNNRAGRFSGLGAAGRYYQVALTEPGTITVNMNPTVDSLWIGGDQSTLALPANRELSVVVGSEVSAGTLNVNGTLTTGFLTLTGGTVMGTGRITAANGVFNTGGVVAPGSVSALGTLTIEGNYLQTEAGILSIRFQGTASDRLAVTGNAALGGTLWVSGPIDPTQPKLTSRIVSADNVTGRFASVSDPFAFFDASVSYSGDAVTMTVARNETDFADIAVADNQRATAGAIQLLSPTNPVHTAILQLDEAGALVAFNSLSGEIHASVRSVLLDTSRYMRDAVTSRLRQTSQPGSDAATGHGALAPHVQVLSGTTVGLWGQGFGAWGHRKGTGTATIDADTGGFFLGADSVVGDVWRLGLAGGYSQTSLDADQRLSSATADNYHVALYGSAQWGSLDLRLGSALTWHGIDAARQIAFPGFSDSVRSGYDARTAQVFGDIGYTFTSGVTSLEPFAGLAYVSLHTDGFHEEGGAAALQGMGGSNDALFSTLGLRAATRVAVSETSALTLRAMLGWRHAFGDVEPASLMAFDTLPFSVSSTPIARDALIAEAGLDFNIGNNITLGVGYSGQLAKDAQDQMVKGEFTWKF